MSCRSTPAPAPWPAPTRCATLGTLARRRRHDERRGAAHRVWRGAAARCPPTPPGVAATADATRHGSRTGVRPGAGRAPPLHHPHVGRLRTRPPHPLAASAVLTGLTSLGALALSVTR